MELFRGNSTNNVGSSMYPHEPVPPIPVDLSCNRIAYRQPISSNPMQDILSLLGNLCNRIAARSFSNCPFVRRLPASSWVKERLIKNNPVFTNACNLCVKDTPVCILKIELPGHLIILSLHFVFIRCQDLLYLFIDCRFPRWSEYPTNDIQKKTNP